MASEDKFVRVFNSKTRKVDWKVKLREEGEVLAWSPDGKLVAIADGDRFLHVLDAKDGAEVRKITVADSRHTPITFSNDSRMLISGGDQHLHLHDVETGKRITPGLGIPAAPKGFETFAVGPEGRRIYAGIDEKLYSWNRDAKGEQSMVDEKETIYSLAASPNGEEFGVGLEGGEIRIRGVEGKELKSSDKGKKENKTLSPELRILGEKLKQQVTSGELSEDDAKAKWMEATKKAPKHETPTKESKQPEK